MLKPMRIQSLTLALCIASSSQVKEYYKVESHEDNLIILSPVYLTEEKTISLWCADGA